jgi:recombination protein RecA
MAPRKQAEPAPPTLPTDGPRTASGRAFNSFEEKFTAKFGAAGATRASKMVKPEIFSTGSIALDYALGVGGIPRGRLISVQGAEACGKTSLSMLAVASAQRSYPNQLAAWVDPEGTFDPDWAATLGVDLDRLVIVTKPASAEDAADAVHMLVEGSYNSIVVLDSVGAMLGRAEQEALSEDAKVALIARIMTRLAKQVCGLGAQNGTTTWMVNQLRAKIDSSGRAGTTATGGFCLAHMTSVRFDVGRGYDAKTVRKMLIDGEQTEVGYQAVVRVTKNKLGPRNAPAHVWIYNRPTDQYGPAGIGLAEEALTFGVRLAVIDQKGAWYVMPDDTRHNGKPAAVDHLRKNPDLVADIRARAIASLAHEPGELPPGVDPGSIVDLMPEEEE